MYAFRMMFPVEERKMGDLLLLFQQISIEEAEDWIGEITKERRESSTWRPSPLHINGSWVNGDKKCQVQMGPKPMPAMEGKKGNRINNEDPMDGRPGKDRRVSILSFLWKRTRKKNARNACRGEREE